MSLELKWFIYVLIQHEIVTPEFALTLLARLGQNNTTLEIYAQQLYELLSADADAAGQSKIMQQIQSYIEYTMQQSETGEEPPEIYELEIVDDDDAETEFIMTEEASATTETTENAAGFDPFAGRGAAPVRPNFDDTAIMPAPPEPENPVVDDEEFEEDSNITEIMEAPEETISVDDAPPPAVKELLKESSAKPFSAQKDFAELGKLHTSIAKARSSTSEEADTVNDGPSVEEIMAAFNRKHGVTPTPAQKSEPRMPATAMHSPAAGGSMANGRPAATETTRSLKKVKVDAKVFSGGSSSKTPSPVDTVPLSLPKFFTDTAHRTLKIDALPNLDNIESQNAGECAPLLMDIIAVLRRNHISDLYINAGEPLFVRRYGLISYLNTPKLSAKAAEQLNFSLLNTTQKNAFTANGRLAFALALRDGRCRCNLRKQTYGISGCYHLAPADIKPLTALGFLPDDVESIHKMLDADSGLIVVSGPAGSGRTTTLAAMVDYISKKRADEIVMLENPIEIIQDSTLGDVIQREIGNHSASTNVALQAAMRQDPNVVVLSEIYNQSTIEQALRAAEGGVLVIVSMYATSINAVLARLTEVFDPMRRPEIRAMLSGSLRGIVVQKLLPSAKNDEQTAIYESMTNTPKMAALLVDGKIQEVSTAIRSGREKGMCSFDSNVIRKYRAGDITGEVAQNAIHHPEVREKVELEVAISEARKLLKARKEKNIQ